jgi:hypothetical protein
MKLELGSGGNDKTQSVSLRETAQCRQLSQLHSAAVAADSEHIASRLEFDIVDTVVLEIESRLLIGIFPIHSLQTPGEIERKQSFFQSLYLVDLLCHTQPLSANLITILHNFSYSVSLNRYLAHPTKSRRRLLFGIRQRKARPDIDDTQDR